MSQPCRLSVQITASPGGKGSTPARRRRQERRRSAQNSPEEALLLPSVAARATHEHRARTSRRPFLQPSPPCTPPRPTGTWGRGAALPRRRAAAAAAAARETFFPTAAAGEKCLWADPEKSAAALTRQERGIALHMRTPRSSAASAARARPWAHRTRRPLPVATATGREAPLGALPPPRLRWAAGAAAGRALPQPR